jgi:hypothetical protein
MRTVAAEISSHCAHLIHSDPWSLLIHSDPWSLLIHSDPWSLLIHSDPWSRGPTSVHMTDVNSLTAGKF